MAIKVFAYGCKPPREGAALVDEQIWKAHRYYNNLIELHRKQRADAEALRQARFPDYAAAEAAFGAAEAALVELEEAVKRRNAAARKKRASAEDRAALKAARLAKKEARLRRSAIRKAIAEDADLQAALGSLYAAVKEAKRLARKTCGAYWGSYLRIEAAVEQAISDSVGPPDFRHWNGDGQIAVQVQKGATWEDLVLQRGKIANLVRVESLPVNPRFPRVSPRRPQPKLFWLRCGSDENRAPVWCKVLVYMHRPLPEGATITGVVLARKHLPPYRTKDGWKPRYDWSLQFTVRLREPVHAATGACGIDLGWRLMPDKSVRIAYLADDGGAVSRWLAEEARSPHPAALVRYCEIVPDPEEPARPPYVVLSLPAALVRRWHKAEALQAIRDRLFDAAKAQLGEWLQAHTPPDWLKDATVFLVKWRSQARLARVLNSWLRQRVEGDTGIVETLSRWRQSDAHLWQWQAANMQKALRIRADLYRCFAARVHALYGTIAVEDCDWRELARNPSVGDNMTPVAAKAYARIASVGFLRDLLVRRGALQVPAENTTKRCHVCGSIEEWDQAAELAHTCVNNHTWDQDANAAINLLELGKNPPPPPPPDPNKPPKPPKAPRDAEQGGRWRRRKAAKKAKEDGAGA